MLAGQEHLLSIQPMPQQRPVVKTSSLLIPPNSYQDSEYELSLPTFCI